MVRRPTGRSDGRFPATTITAIPMSSAAMSSSLKPYAFPAHRCFSDPASELDQVGATPRLAIDSGIRHRALSRKLSCPAGGLQVPLRGLFAAFRGLRGPPVHAKLMPDDEGMMGVADPHGSLRALLPKLVAFARVMLGDAEAARDIVQEAAARALAAARVPSDAAAYRAWMFRIVRNAAVDEIRRRRQPDADVHAMADLWRFDDARIAKITVQQGLTMLGVEHREIISLIDIAGFSYSDVAAMLGVPVGTVMSRIARAREALLAAIDASAVRPLKSRHG